MMISPSSMLTSGIMPPSGMKLSSMAFTAPHEAAVVTTANRVESVTPKRTSLPSMLPAALSTPSAPSSGLPPASAQ